MRKRLLLTLLIVACITVLTGKRIFDQPGTRGGRDLNEPVVVSPPSELEPVIAEFERFIRFRMQKEGIPGVAVAMVKDTNVIYLKTFGLKERFGRDSVNIHTVFRLASVSKGFAPILTGMLVREGLLRWDDRVIDYLPDFALSSRENTERLTLRHVLSHTTGLPRHTYSNLLDNGVPYPEIRAKLRNVRLANEVGTCFNYQNVAYSLIGDVIEKVTGKTYQQMLRERIFLPLGMTDASASYAEMIQCRNVAIPHRYRSNTGYYATDISPRYYSVSPAAGVNASITDMTRWLTFLLGHRPDVLSSELLDEVFRPEIPLPSRDLGQWHTLMDRAHYAMGWRVLECGPDTLVYHGGYVNAFRSEIALLRKDGFGIVVLTNAPSGFISSALPTFFAMYQMHRQRKFDPLAPLVTAIPPSSLEWKKSDPNE